MEWAARWGASESGAGVCDSGPFHGGCVVRVFISAYVCVSVCLCVFVDATSTNLYL